MPADARVQTIMMIFPKRLSQLLQDEAEPSSVGCRLTYNGKVIVPFSEKTVDSVKGL
jgi:hypothetical protein